MHALQQRSTQQQSCASTSGCPTFRHQGAHTRFPTHVGFLVLAIHIGLPEIPHPLIQKPELLTHVVVQNKSALSLVMAPQDWA